MGYRLGLDLGTNSIGWAMLELDSKDEPCGIKDIGVRIFPSGRTPKTGASLAVDRRVARSARRQRGRYKKRRQRLTELLVSLGLLPAKQDVKERDRIDPYELRAKAIGQKLEPYELGRALFHINQRRGFKSNKKLGAVDKKQEEEEKKIAKGVKTLDDRLKSDGDVKKTLGQYLYESLQSGGLARFKPELTGIEKIAGGAKKAQNGEEPKYIYPSREMIEDELKQIRNNQAKYHDKLSEKSWDEIEDTILFQRPLLPVEPGWCTLNTKEKRAPWALPTAQHIRIWQELANLKLEGASLTKEEINILAKLLINLKSMDKKNRLTFAKMRKELDKDRSLTFNLEGNNDGRVGLKGDETACILSKPELFGKQWFGLGRKEQDAVVEKLLKGLEGRGEMNAFDLWKKEPTQKEELVNQFVEEFNLTKERARALVDTTLPTGYANLGINAMNELLPFMEEDKYYRQEGKPIGITDAIRLSRKSPIDESTGDGGLDELPYYGEVLRKATMGGDDKSENDEECYGKIANPAVHVALNQLRRVVNAIIREYGKPDSIIVETSRDLKNSKKEREKIGKEQAKNRKRNEKTIQTIREAEGVPTDPRVRKVRLWEDQGKPSERICPYCGKNIPFEKVMTDDTEIDHILPRRTLDDSRANKVVAHRGCNRKKRDRAPYEAFGGITEGDYAYEKILERVSGWPKAKKWRFKMEAAEIEEGFIARQYTDTSYISTEARKYLLSVCKNVQAVPGVLTAKLRKRWGLNTILPGNKREFTCQGAESEEIFKFASEKEQNIEAELLPSELKRNVKNYSKLWFRKDGENLIFEFFLKDRSDHRHHAIDAFVVGMTSRSILKKVSDAARYPNSERVRENVIRLLPDEPWSGFKRANLEEKIEAINVSHKPKRMQPGKIRTRKGRDSTSGRLHDKTAYGIACLDGERVFVANKSLKLPGDLRKKFIGGGDGPIVDEDLREALTGLWDEVSARGGSDIEKQNVFHAEVKKPGALERFGFQGAKDGVKSARMYKNIISTTIPVKDSRGEVYKFYESGSNAFMDIYRLPNANGKWEAFIVPVFYANQPVEEFEAWYQKNRPQPPAKKVMRLFRNDCVALEEDGERKLYRVQKMNNQNLCIVELKEGNVDARTRDKIDTYKMKEKWVDPLRKLGMRKVHIDEMGRVYDPGPNKP